MLQGNAFSWSHFFLSIRGRSISLSSLSRLFLRSICKFFYSFLTLDTRTWITCLNQIKIGIKGVKYQSDRCYCCFWNACWADGKKFYTQKTMIHLMNRVLIKLAHSIVPHFGRKSTYDDFPFLLSLSLFISTFFSCFLSSFLSHSLFLSNFLSWSWREKWP